MPSEFEDQRVTVMGLGRFGGGAGVTRWLAEQGATVLVTDKDPAERLAASLAGLRDLVDAGRLSLRLGEHNVSDFTTADLVVANPAVPRPWEDRFLRSAQAGGVPVTTEIRLLTERLNRKRVIGVTGSAGKSTTAAMIHHVLARCGERSHLGGNIGGSLLNLLNEIHPDDWVVLELSSAMLYWLGAGVGYAAAKGWSPQVAVLTNITPNHIDWHGDFEHYRESKMNIFRWQDEHDQRIDDCGLTIDDSRFQSSIVNRRSSIPLKIPGEHNQMNARLAIAAAQCATDMTATECAALLTDFAGLPHRLQLVAERDGMTFYNDSKSTTPEATVLAVESFHNPSRVHLIAGGYDKKIDLASIANLTPRIAGLYTIGATGLWLAEAGARGEGFSSCCHTLEQAVFTATGRMHSGDILLMSPGCASWDQFTNFEERGEEFTKLVTVGMQESALASPHHQS